MHVHVFNPIVFAYIAAIAVGLAMLVFMRRDLLAEKDRRRKKMILVKWLVLAVYLAVVLLLRARGIRIGPLVILGCALLINFTFDYRRRRHAKKFPAVELPRPERLP